MVGMNLCAEIDLSHSARQLGTDRNELDYGHSGLSLNVHAVFRRVPTSKVDLDYQNGELTKGWRFFEKSAFE